MKKLALLLAVPAVALWGTSCSASPLSAALGPASASSSPVVLPQSIGLDGTLPDVNKVEVGSPHVYDYTFASAPTDWRVQSGIWEMTNRWACSPGWSWFGGRSSEIASIWNKRKFSGDISVQFYFGFKMENSGTFNQVTGQYRWWEYPTDVAVTIGGDGSSLASGYTLVIGANDNRHTVLRRREEVVADSEAPEALLTGYYDSVPTEMDRLIHRRWWYGRIDKIGDTVLCYLDNHLLFSYRDTQPLDAGQVALWTYNNGIMLSRVQIYYSHEVRPSYVKKETQFATELAAVGHGQRLAQSPKAANPASNAPHPKFARNEVKRAIGTAGIR